MIKVKNDLVSVITPLYNSEEFIADTIESVIAQTYQDWEMIIVDDHSTDNGPQIVENYVKRDDRIKLVTLAQNSGAAVARNKAIEQARGRYLAFLDSDDLWKPEKLMRQLEFMKRNKYIFSFTNYQYMTEDGKLINKIIKSPEKLSYNKALYTNYVGCLTAIYDTKDIGKHYMPLIRKRQDYAYWLKLLKKVGNGYGLNENLAYYRLRNNSVSANKIKLLKYQWKMYREFEELSIVRTCFYIWYTIMIKLLHIK